jgi:sugar lactone lactonase YvrE
MSESTIDSADMLKNGSAGARLQISQLVCDERYSTNCARAAISRGTYSDVRRSIALVEIAAGTLSGVDKGGHISVIAHLGVGPNGGAALRPDGCCYVCNSGGFQWRVDEHGMRPLGQADDHSGGRIERVDLRTGNVVRFYDRTKNGPLRRPNDLVFDRSGGFWFADSGTRLATRASFVAP